jgi:hypothetical protein
MKHSYSFLCLFLLSGLDTLEMQSKCLAAGTKVFEK